MIMSKSKPVTPGAAIFYGRLIAGIPDAAEGVVDYYIAAGFKPIQVLQFMASGFYGAAAFQEGSSCALVDLSSPIFSSLLRSPPSTWEQPGFCPC